MSDARMWYVAVGGEAVGPMGKEDLLQGLRSGEYNQETMVFATGMTAWTAVAQVPELVQAAGPARGVPPPPPGAGERVAHNIDFEIFGEEMQFVEVELDPGESVVSEAGPSLSVGPDGSLPVAGPLSQTIEAGPDV